MLSVTVFKPFVVGERGSQDLGPEGFKLAEVVPPVVANSRGRVA